VKIESDSLISLRAICTHTDKYEDLNWSGIQNLDLLKSMLIKLRTRPAQTPFKWVKGHKDNNGNIRADALADTGRNSNLRMREDDEDWIDNHEALQDGARLQVVRVGDGGGAGRIFPDSIAIG